MIFVPVNFSQHVKDAHAIYECFEELVARLAKIIPNILPGSKEDDLAQALGHYLCAVSNAVSAYEHLTRLIDYYGKRKRLQGVIRVWRARRAFDREVNEYLKNGVVLQRARAEMEAVINYRWPKKRAGHFLLQAVAKNMRAGKCFKSHQSGQPQDFTLAAAGTGQHQLLFASRFIKPAGQRQTIWAALEAFHVKPPEGTFRQGVRGSSSSSRRIKTALFALPMLSRPAGHPLSYLTGASNTT